MGECWFFSGSSTVTSFFFHVDHDTPYTGKGLLKVGDVVDTSCRKHNPFYGVATDFHSEYPINGKASPLLEFFRSSLAHERASDVMPHVHHIIESHLKIIQELVFETVRAEHYRDLPSRTRCLWLSESEEGARSWIGRLDQRKNPRVLRVAVEGRLHTTSEGHLHQDSQSMNQLLTNAGRYWRGEHVPGSRSETLLEGTMTILEVIG